MVILMRVGVSLSFENSLTTPSNSCAYMQPPTMQESSDISKRHPFSLPPLETNKEKDETYKQAISIDGDIAPILQGYFWL